MTALWSMLLRSDLPNDILEDLHFAVFGLGDSSYEKFCWPAKKLARRLVGLGATQMCHRGEGDDQHYFGLVSTRTSTVLGGISFTDCSLGSTGL
jgi:sulfite reductase alpha subunit-like flavoprotein